jgi:hypothetical protein
MKGDTPRYNLPIEVIHRQPDTVPFCHECPSPLDVVKNLPWPPTAAQTHLGAGFKDASLRDAKPPASSAERQTGAKKKVTTDDLMKDLDL